MAKITMDGSAFETTKRSAVADIRARLGARVTISGDVITVNSRYEEDCVIDSLNERKVGYSKSS